MSEIESGSEKDAQDQGAHKGRTRDVIETSGRMKDLLYRTAVERRDQKRAKNVGKVNGAPGRCREGEPVF